MKMLFSRINLGRNEVIKNLPSGELEDQEAVGDLSKDADLDKLFSKPTKPQNQHSNKLKTKTGVQTVSHT